MCVIQFSLFFGIEVMFQIILQAQLMWFQLITGLKENHFLIVCQVPEDSREQMYISVLKLNMGA